jgi:hypothetical protein
MMQAVLAYLKQSPDRILTELPILSTLITVMEGYLNALAGAVQIQQTVAVGAGANKEAKKRTLVDLALSVGRGIYSFANHTENTELSVLMNDLMKGLPRIADVKLISRCTTIYEKGNEYKDDLGPYGITEAVLNTLNQVINDYKGQGEDVRLKITERVNAGKNISSLLTSITRLLKREIDPAVYSLPDTEHDYKTEYRNNRIIIDLGHRFTQFKGKAIDKITHEKVAFTEIEFISADRRLTVKADESGNYRERLNPDIYDIIARHPNYEPFVINGVKIQAGEIKVENFELIPKSE